MSTGDEIPKTPRIRVLSKPTVKSSSPGLVRGFLVRKGPAGVAVLAAAASIYFGISSKNAADYQSRATARQQLETLVQALADGPKTNLTTQVEAEEAAHIIKALGNDVSASAAYEVAQAFAYNGEIENSLAYYNLATEKPAQDSGLVGGSGLTASAFLGEARLNYLQGHLTAARSFIKSAIKAQGTDSFGKFAVAENHVYADLVGAGWEIYSQRCSKASKYLRDATDHMDQVNPGDSYLPTIVKLKHTFTLKLQTTGPNKTSRCSQPGPRVLPTVQS